jgi:excisionase family DNA binding protein
MEMTIKEAARHLNVSEQTIRRKLASGVISGTKERHRWKVTIDDKGPAAEGADPVSQSEILWLREQLETRTREVAELHQLLAAHSLNPGPPAPEPEPPPYLAPSTPWWAFWR